jgi:hypothetical protein
MSGQTIYILSILWSQNDPFVRTSKLSMRWPHKSILAILHKFYLYICIPLFVKAIHLASYPGARLSCWTIPSNTTWWNISIFWVTLGPRIMFVECHRVLISQTDF